MTVERSKRRSYRSYRNFFRGYTVDSGYELPFPSHPATSSSLLRPQKMAEASAEANHSVPFNPFDAEVLMLLRAETEMVEERWKGRLAKGVKVKPKNVTKPLVTKPVWPYEMWQVNYLDSPSEFNRQKRLDVPFSCTSENNQPGQMSNPDHGSSLLDATTDSCESRLFREAADKESMPHMEAIAATDREPLGMEAMTDILQRSINMLSDLQDLFSICDEKYSPTGDSGRNETDLTTAEETQRILEEMNENSKRDTGVEGNLQLPCTDDKSTPFDFGVGLKKSSEKVTPVSPNKVYSEENIQKESKESAEFEVLRPRVPETSLCCETDHAVSTVFDAFGLKEDTTYSTTVRAQETMEAKSGEKGSGKVKCKESQTKLSESEEDMVVMNMDKAPKQVKEISTSKVHHLKTELQSAVSAQSVLNTTIREWLLSVSIDRLVKTEHIKHLVRSLMNNTVSELQTKHDIFSKCYIIETGSMAEGTKIGQPDEFDFTIALPMLADSDVAELLYIKLGIQTRLHNNIRDEVLSFLGQFSFVDSSYRHYLTNAYLLQVFRETMKKHLPLEWAMRE